MSERPQSGELERPELCAKPPDQPRPTLRASSVAVMPKHWFDCASDASNWWLGLPAHVLCGSLPQPAVLMRSPPQLPRKAGRSDQCSRHQNGSTGHSLSCVIRVTQLCQISRVCRDLAQYGGTVALATTQAPLDLTLIATASVQRVLGLRAPICRPVFLNTIMSSRSPAAAAAAADANASAFHCVLGDVLSARAGRDAAARYG